MSIEVLEPGLLTSIQDPFGRRDWRHVGVPVGGAADAWSARLANRLVGNPDGAAVLEMTAIGPTLRFARGAAVALTGAMDATIEGSRLPPGIARAVRAGATVRVREGSDLRAYLAVRGGLVVPPILGSTSTDLRTGFGGLDGRALRAADRLAFGAFDAPLARWTGRAAAGPIRIVDGPHVDRCRADALTAATWRIGSEADRAGVRLDGPRLTVRGPDVPSMGLPLGALQVPPDGRPIVMLADRPVTGGYPVPALVIGADVGRVARLRPGDEVTFASVSLDEARSAMRRATNELAALEVLDAPADDELGWAGSHE